MTEPGGMTSELTIGGLVVSPNAVRNVSYSHAIRGSRHVKSICVQIDAGEVGMSQADYAGHVRLRLTAADGTTARDFGGWVTRACPSDDGRFVTIEATDTVPADGIRGRGFIGDLDNTDKLHFLIENSQMPWSAHDLPPPSPVGDVLVVMAAMGVAGPTPPLDAFGVTFHAVTAVDDGEEAKAAQVALGNVPVGWETELMRCRTLVHAPTLWQAMRTGQDRILSALDWLNIRMHLTAAQCGRTGSTRVLEFRRACRDSVVRPTGWTYARDTSSEDRLRAVLWHSDASTDQEGVAIDAADPYWSAICAAADTCSESGQGEVSREQRIIGDAARFLARACIEANRLDAFLYLWLAFERLMADQDHASTLGPREQETVRRALDALRSDGGEASLSKLSPEQHDRLKAVISMAGNLPLRDQFGAFVTKYEVELAVSTADRLWGVVGLRRKRNDIVHGSAVVINQDDLDTMRSVVERMLLARLYSATAADRPDA